MTNQLSIPWVNDYEEIMDMVYYDSTGISNSFFRSTLLNQYEEQGICLDQATREEFAEYELTIGKC